MPADSNYNSINLRFWDTADVSGKFSTVNLKSLHHFSSRLNDLDPVITFNAPVTVTGTVYLQEAYNSSKYNEKGVSMKFNGGLSGNPHCVVHKHKPSSGCGWASCSETIATDTTCSCTSSECKIKVTPTCLDGEIIDENTGLCKIDHTVCTPYDETTGGLYWNADGTYTIPGDRMCWRGYGAYSTITVSDGSSYTLAEITFWKYATIIGSFETKVLRVANTQNDTVVTFKNPVRVTGVVYIPDTNELGSIVFEKGLFGSMKCKVYGSSTKTCSCTTTGCSINK